LSNWQPKQQNAANNANRQIDKLANWQIRKK